MNAAAGADADALGDDPVAAVAAWRAQHGAAVDAVSARVIEALARRAAAQDGAAREVIIQRIAALLRAPGRPPVASSQGAPGVTRAVERQAALRSLSALVDRLGRARSRPEMRNSAGVDVGGAPPLGSTGPLGAVTAFRATWSRLRAQQRLRQALLQVPAQAGPLNSAQLVSRALQAMHDAAPDYLDAFMAHIDTLLWLEQAGKARKH